jgi:hypothetical protein
MKTPPEAWSPSGAAFEDGTLLLFTEASGGRTRIAGARSP